MTRLASPRAASAMGLPSSREGMNPSASVSTSKNSPNESRAEADQSLSIPVPLPRLTVVEGCDGVTAFILTMAVVLSTPRPVGERLRAMLVLLPLLFVINWLRLFILTDIRFYLPDYFRLFHVYLFQPSMIFITFACLMAWLVHGHGDQKTP